MGTIRRFEDIEAWKTARELSRQVYELSKGRPFAQDFALRDQIRRAAVSTLSNIAEGFESRTTALFIEFLGRAKGSVGEVRAQCYVALDAGHISQEQFEQVTGLAERCSRQISNFMSYLQNASSRNSASEGAPEYKDAALSVEGPSTFEPATFEPSNPADGA